MGLFWDLIQQSQISEQQQKAGSLEERVGQLETELHDMKRLQSQLLNLLEEKFGQDINQDGKIGG